MRLPAMLFVVLSAATAVYPAPAAQKAKQERAATREVIRDKLGRTMGEIRPVSGGRLEARNRLGRMLGTYDPKSNETRDRLGRVLAKGNILSALIVKAAEQKK